MKWLRPREKERKLEPNGIKTVVDDDQPMVVKKDSSHEHVEPLDLMYKKAEHEDKDLLDKKAEHKDDLAVLKQKILKLWARKTRTLLAQSYQINVRGGKKAFME